MKNKTKKLNNKKIMQWSLLAILLTVTFYTRFVNLGYSDYIGDEHKAFLQLEKGQNIWQFLMEQRKGPMQFFVSHIPYLLTGDFRHELFQRIPFALISVAAIVVFFLLIKKLTRDFYTALVAAFLLTVNGFIVGFGRIAQYQNLNLLFSFLALYFYADIVRDSKERDLTKKTMLGTLFWCLSMLSHWDAVFILPVAAILFLLFLKREDVEKDLKIKVIRINILLGCALLLPYLIPYIRHQISSPANSQYFRRRVEFGYINTERYKTLFELYNPFVTFYVFLILGTVGALMVKKSYLFSAWFVFAYFIFEFFVRKPGTHIYNFIIPLTVLCALAVTTIYKFLPKFLNYLWTAIITFIMAFMIYQAHFIFIDHKEEYPWEQKVLYDFTPMEKKKYDRKRVLESDRVYHQVITPKYTIEQKLPLFGFPHKRYWNEINAFINEQNEENEEDLEYITNEVKTISEWYMDTGYASERPFYIVGVKRPLSFTNDYKYPQIGGKNTVREIENDYGETVVRIYYVKEK